jgi:CHAD domain-containing protein
MVKWSELMDAAELLNGPADEGSRRVALALLDAAIVARARLDDPSDPEALHDFRVALRRLRSWIRAFRRELRGSVRPKYRRRLRAVSRAAGAARDAEVHVAWLRDAEESLGARERIGGEWLLRRAVDQQRHAGAAFNATAAAMFLPTANALAKELAVYTVRVDLRDLSPRRTFAEAAAPLILADATALGERLSAVQSSQDQALAHAARIAGKRLRYLLEPIATGVDGAAALVKRLRHLQDTIGEMHDVHVMAADVIQAAETAGAEQARRVATALLESDTGDHEAQAQQARDPRLGLLAVAAQLRARGEAAFAELRGQWLGDRVHVLVMEARDVAARMLGTPSIALTASATADASPQSLEVPEAAIDDDATHCAVELADVDDAMVESPRRDVSDAHPAEASRPSVADVVLPAMALVDVADPGRRLTADIPVAITALTDHSNGADGVAGHA